MPPGARCPGLPTIRELQVGCLYYGPQLRMSHHSATTDRFLFLLAATYCLWVVMRGWSTGIIPLQFSTFRRSQNAVFYWVSMGLHVVVGVCCLLGFVFGPGFWK